MHRKRWIIALTSIGIFTAASLIESLALAASQEPPAPKPAGNESSSGKRIRQSHANDLLIRGTMFDNHGLSLRGGILHIRRSGEKKNRWATQTNSRGEFAIRVPQGSDYEVAAEAKGFAKQSHAINAKNGNAEEKVIFHMEPLSGGKR